MSYYALCSFAGGIDWGVPEELEGRNPGETMELTKMLILHDWDADTVLSQNKFGLLTQDSEEIVGLQFYRKRYFYCS